VVLLVVATVEATLMVLTQQLIPVAVVAVLQQHQGHQQQAVMAVLE
jgi:hypothetical protein